MTHPSVNTRSKWWTNAVNSARWSSRPGGPHIEVAADGAGSARLEGYWWGDRHTVSGDQFDVFLDYFIERD